jgi:hypothetical protein
VLILLFLPALYAAWFRIKPVGVDEEDKATRGAEQRDRPFMAAAAE